MVCKRCIFVVESDLKTIGLDYVGVSLGEITFKNMLSPTQTAALKEQLERSGFEILNDSSSKTIEKIKLLLIDLIQNEKSTNSSSFSTYLREQLHQDYSKLSNLFSQIEGISIEKYFINLKIEKVKELLIYDELSLSEIANLLNYSSVSHLSHQFKKVTGFSPSYFKKLKEKNRTELDQL